MYKCFKCLNVNKFKEINVINSYVNQEDGNINLEEDKFLYREDVICLVCGETMNKGIVVEGVYLYE